MHRHEHIRSWCATDVELGTALFRKPARMERASTTAQTSGRSSALWPWHIVRAPGTAPYAWQRGSSAEAACTTLTLVRSSTLVWRWSNGDCCIWKSFIRYLKRCSGFFSIRLMLDTFRFRKNLGRLSLYRSHMCDVCTGAVKSTTPPSWSCCLESPLKVNHRRNLQYRLSLTLVIAPGRTTSEALVEVYESLMSRHAIVHLASAQCSSAF